MSHRLFSHLTGSTCRVRSTQFTTPSGLTLEVLPPRPRSLLPLAITTLLLWCAVGAAVWWVWSN